jgi:hypothetical protein
MIEVVNLTSLFLEKGIVKVMNEYNGKDLLAPKE